MPLIFPTARMFAEVLQWWLLGTCSMWMLAFGVYPLLMCIAHDSVPTIKTATYFECVERQYVLVSGVSGFTACAVVLLLGRKALWEEELSKVAGMPEVMGGLRRVSDGIVRELQEQQRLALRSLGV
ncbi:hypothetical protein T484DRAFT_1780385, partial [Baffinella frigidus]